MSISDTSRYLMTLGATRINDGLTYILDREPLRFQPRADNKRVVARSGDTWWSLASEHLAALTTPEQMFWAICDYQPLPVLDPTVDPAPGTIVYIPDEDFVMSHYFADSRREQDAI